MATSNLGFNPITGGVEVQVDGTAVATFKTAGNGMAIPAAVATTDSAQYGQVAMVKIASQTASNSANISFTGINGSLYSELILVLSEVNNATVATQLCMQISTGSGFITTGYSDAQYRTIQSGGSGGGGSSSIAYWNIGFYTELNSSGSYYNAEIKIGNPSGSNANKRMQYLASGLSSNVANLVVAQGGGICGTNSASMDGIKIFASSGNIASGNFSLYGVRV